MLGNSIDYSYFIPTLSHAEIRFSRSKLFFFKLTGAPFLDLMIKTKYKKER